MERDADLIFRTQRALFDTTPVVFQERGVRSGGDRIASQEKVESLIGELRERSGADFGRITDQFLTKHGDWMDKLAKVVNATIGVVAAAGIGVGAAAVAGVGPVAAGGSASSGIGAGAGVASGANAAGSGTVVSGAQAVTAVSVPAATAPGSTSTGTISGAAKYGAVIKSGVGIGAGVASIVNAVSGRKGGSANPGIGILPVQGTTDGGTAYNNPAPASDKLALYVLGGFALMAAFFFLRRK